MGKIAEKKEKLLTPLQEKFVINLIEGNNLTESYKNAGYSYENMKPVTVNRRAKEVWDKPHVRARYKELISGHEEDVLRKRNLILEGLYKAYYMALGIEEVTDITKTRFEGMYEIHQDEYRKTDLSAVVKIAEQIAKYEGFYEQEEKGSGDVNVNIVIPELGTDEEKENGETENFLKRNGVKI